MAFRRVPSDGGCMAPGVVDHARADRAEIKRSSVTDRWAKYGGGPVSSRRWLAGRSRSADGLMWQRILSRKRNDVGSGFNQQETADFCVVLTVGPEASEACSPHTSLAALFHGGTRCPHTAHEQQGSPYASCHGLQPPPSAARLGPASRAFPGPSHAPPQTTQPAAQQARRLPRAMSAHNPPPLTPLLTPYLAQELAPPFALLATCVHARSSAPVPPSRARWASLMAAPCCPPRWMRCGFGSRGERYRRIVATGHAVPPAISPCAPCHLPACAALLERPCQPPRLPAGATAFATRAGPRVAALECPCRPPR